MKYVPRFVRKSAFVRCCVVGSCFVFVLFKVSPASCQSTVTVVVQGVRDQKGVIRVALFDKAEHFLEKPVYSGHEAARGDRVTVVMSNVREGSYGLSVFHDLNANEELDTNALGIPKEGFGFGNDALGVFGPPSFDRASVKVEGDSIKVLLRLRHFRLGGDE